MTLDAYYQVKASMGSLSAVSLWLNWAYGTSIFITISARLTSHTTSTTTFGILSESLLRGCGLPRTMRHLLQDGQTFCMYVPVLIPALGRFNEAIISTALAFILLTTTITISPQVGPIYQAAFAIPQIAIESNMVCKMLRAMIIHSLDVDQRGSLALAEGYASATKAFDLNTILELDARMMNAEHEPFGYEGVYVRFRFVPCLHFSRLMMIFWQSRASHSRG